MKLKIFYYQNQERKGMLITEKINKNVFINENAILYINKYFDINGNILYEINFGDEGFCIEDEDSINELKKQLNNYIQINTEYSIYFINKSNYSYMEKLCETQMMVYFSNRHSILINNLVNNINI